MSKVDIAYGRILDVLQENKDACYTLDYLRSQVNWALPLEDMVSMATLRRALARLPEGCVTKDQRGRVRVQPRNFARPEEVVAALRGVETWCDDLPVLIDRFEAGIRRALGLADAWAWYQSLKWAAMHGQFEIIHGYYGMSVRWLGKREMERVS